MFIAELKLFSISPLINIILKSFYFSGKILKKLGYGYTFTFCFICYALRLGLISLASTPWWVLLIEFFMQGPSYALSFTAIISYANVITPTGASATVQGLVQGVNEGLGKIFYTVLYVFISINYYFIYKKLNI